MAIPANRCLVENKGREKVGQQMVAAVGHGMIEMPAQSLLSSKRSGGRHQMYGGKRDLESLKAFVAAQLAHATCLSKPPYKRKL